MATIISFEKKKGFLRSNTEILRTNAYKINEKLSSEHKVYDYYEFKQKQLFRNYTHTQIQWPYSVITRSSATE